MRITVTGLANYLTLEDGGQAAILELLDPMMETDLPVPQPTADTFGVRIQSWHDAPVKADDHPIIAALHHKRLRITIEILDEQY